MFALRLFRTSHELIRGGSDPPGPPETHCTQRSFKNTRPFTAAAYWEKQSVCSWRTSTVCRREDPAEAPTDEIAAFGRTTAIFFLFFADTLHKWLGVCPACNWGLWMSSSVYIHFTDPFSAFFWPVRIGTLSRRPIILSVIVFCSSRTPPTHQGGVGPFSHSA